MSEPPHQQAPDDTDAVTASGDVEPEASGAAAPADGPSPDAEAPERAEVRPSEPRHQALRAAQSAFASGNNRLARDVLCTIADSEPPEVLAARDALWRSVRPDRVALLIALVGFVIVSVVGFLALTR